MFVVLQLFKKIKKLVIILSVTSYRKALRLGVAAAVEHQSVLRQLQGCQVVVDIGANRGQFALVVRHCLPSARVISFEPLIKPIKILKKILSNDYVQSHHAAIGPKVDTCIMHISARDDSSSLLPIASQQKENFPGTHEIGNINVSVAPLDYFLKKSDIAIPALLKLDVQGFEMQALLGCESLLANFNWVYCECSFVELYTGQALAHCVIEWLSAKGFQIKGIYNNYYNTNGVAIQADFLFERVAN